MLYSSHKWVFYSYKTHGCRDSMAPQRMDILFITSNRASFYSKRAVTNTLVICCIYGVIPPRSNNPYEKKKHMAAAQNVRSGSSPVPTRDPDLRSRPFERIWSRPLEWHNVLVSWCLVQWWLHVIGFPALQLFTLPSSQATNCCKATLPSCKLPSCPCRKVALLSSQAV